MVSPCRYGDKIRNSTSKHSFFDRGGRRINPPVPDKSLILLKATAQVPHRGGRRFDVTSAEYEVLRDWIARGTPAPSSDAPRVVKLEVVPREAILVDPVSQVEPRVTALFSDGTSRDVTERACYELSNLIATVDRGGRVTRDNFGETTLIVRYLQQQVSCVDSIHRGAPGVRLE